MDETTPTSIRVDYSFSTTRANLLSPFLAIIPMVLLSGLYVAVWGVDPVQVALFQVYGGSIEAQIGFLVATVLALILASGAHELIHGAVWVLSTGKPFASAVELSIDWKALMPYTFCKELVTVSAYRVGIAMPGIILGILPSLAAVVIGNFWILTFGLIMVLGAGGDMMILCKLYGVDAAKLAQDHPSRVGCFVIENETPP